MNEKKTWSDKENEICCEVCVDLYVVQKTDVSINECVSKIKLQPEIANRDAGTIRCKIQNIKYLLDDWKVPNTLKISGRENCSDKNKGILKNILKKMGYLGAKTEMKREVTDCEIKDRNEYLKKLGLKKTEAGKDDDLNGRAVQKLEETDPQFRAWKTAWENRKFEIEMYWRRAAYFWVFIAAIYTAFFNVLKMCVEKQIECNTPKCFQAVMLVVLAFLGFVFCLGFFLQNIGSKQWQTNWETHVDLLEDDVVGNLYKIFVQDKKKNFSVTKINEWLCRALTFCSVIVFFWHSCFCA